MKTYLISIMGKKGVFKKEVKAKTFKISGEYLYFSRYEHLTSPFLAIKEWILVEEVTE